ncbi:N-acetylmuramoyl-L-alanine amidase [Actinokineospora enzanensis]|uniref:N-acetylmuramoyl-L-alanine amidase n=1 Tax=Actinokineospora enzanensis TaxID=155975 RepID=UPI00037A9C43|nr:N-acetylmuramoyl-L-alanine amidase [Actinokineospora enzanensis]
MLTRRAAALGLGCALVIALSACGDQSAAPPATAPTATPGSTAVTTTFTTENTTALPTMAPSTTTTTVPTTTTTAKAARPVAAGKTVVLDPGHNGANASNPAEINRLVPAGRGRTKPCNTTGTATNAGYPEHAFTWDLAIRVRDALTARGVAVIMTRPDDKGIGPCVDKRAAIGNDSGATAVVSLHADGSTSAGAHGFHIAYSAPPLNAAQGEPSLRLARVLRDAMVAGGLPTSNYIGSQGLSPRDDLGGLNLSTRPIALVECGNMRDAAEAATLSSPAGRQRYAEAIANGILEYLG